MCLCHCFPGESQLKVILPQINEGSKKHINEAKSGHKRVASLRRIVNLHLDLNLDENDSVFSGIQPVS